MFEKRLIGLIAGLAVGSLIIQTFVDLDADGGTVASVWWNMVRYYTILTNLTVAIVFGAMALSGKRLNAHWSGAITLQIVLVGIVFHALLAASHEFKSIIGEVSNHGFHTVVPALCFLWWLTCAPKSGLGWRNALQWIIWPLVYAAYGIWRGSLDGKYPYYFLDVPELGLLGLLREMSIVAAGFLVFGFILVGIARIQRPSVSSK